MKILLTGHCGYIGTELHYELVARDHDVVGMDLKNGTDLNDQARHDFPDVDLVIHLAGKSGVREAQKDPFAYWYHNVAPFIKLVEAYPETRILYASSSSAYEPSRNEYAFSKMLMEKIAAFHPNALGMRFHTVYSDKPRAGMFLDKYRRGTLEYTTDHQRDFIHLDDVIKAILFLIEKDKETGVIDIGTGESIDISTLVPSLPTKRGVDLFAERPYTKANVKRMEELGWKAEIDFMAFWERFKQYE